VLQRAPTRYYVTSMLRNLKTRFTTGAVSGACRRFEALSPSWACDIPTQRVGPPADGFLARGHRASACFSLENAFSSERAAGLGTGGCGRLLDRPASLGEGRPPPTASASRWCCELKDRRQRPGPELTSVALLVAGRQRRRRRNPAREINRQCAHQFQSVPLRLLLDDPQEWREVRVRSPDPDSTFAAFNASAQREEPLCANRRNAWRRPTLRQLESGRGAARRLEFFAYTLHLPGRLAACRPASPARPPKQVGVPELAGRPAGFRVNPNAAALPPIWRRWRPSSRHGQQQRHQLAYATIGVV